MVVFNSQLSKFLKAYHLALVSQYSQLQHTLEYRIITTAAMATVVQTPEARSESQLVHLLAV